MRSVYLLKSALIGALLTSGAAHAQLVAGEVFLKGNFVEVGIGTLGFYGSNTNAPSGYHPHLGGTMAHIGFVADPGMDGWSTGTPAMMGDYFLPGSPFEGWELQVNGKRIQAFNSGVASAFVYSGGMPTATGTNISYTTSGSKVIGTWQGTIDSMTVTQETTIDSPNLYFTTKVTITNLASTPKNDIYYFRTLDPDNDQTWPGGGFSTNNKITHQMPDTFNVSSVEAVGLSSASAYMAMGTTHTNSRAVIYSAWPVSPGLDLATIYSGTYTTSAYYDEGGTHMGDVAIGLMTYIPHIATVDSAGDSVLRTTSAAHLHPANTASFTIYWAFSKDAADSAIKHINAASVGDTTSDTTIITPSTVSSVNSTNIKVFPNPVYGTLNISGLTIHDKFTLFDMMGRSVASGVATTNGLNSLPLHDVPVGNYVLIATDANGNIKYRQPVRKQ